MPTMTRTDFTTRFQGSRIDLTQAGLSAAEVTRLGRADLNDDGVISGAREHRALFDAVDHFDRNGRRASIELGSSTSPTTPGRIVGALTDRFVPTTVSRTSFVTGLQGHQVDLQRATLADDERAHLAAADLNRDGVIAGAIEADALFTRVDDFDTNGTRRSVNAGTGLAPTPAGRLLLGLRAGTSPVAVDGGDTGTTGGGISGATLRRIVPQLSSTKAAEVARHLSSAMAEANITTTRQKAAFVAQLAHESGGFRYLEEIASGAAYEGRRDLGNTQRGDGRRFKGRGYIQVTGRANYTAAGRALNLDLVNHPELAARPENAARIAAWYWTSRNLNPLAERGDFVGVTRRINGGTNGLADRRAYYARALQALQA